MPRPRFVVAAAAERRTPRGASGTSDKVGKVAAHPDLRALSGGQDTELMAIRIGHHHRADLALADVDSSPPERD